MLWLSFDGELRQITRATNEILGGWAAPCAQAEQRLKRGHRSLPAVACVVLLLGPTIPAHDDVATPIAQEQYRHQFIRSTNSTMSRKSRSSPCLSNSNPA